MQCGLVGDRAMDDGGAVAVVREAQAVEPGGPSGIEMSLEAGSRSDRPRGDRRRRLFFRVIRSFRLVTSQWVPPALRSVAGVNTKLGADVVSGHHHLW